MKITVHCCDCGGRRVFQAKTLRKFKLAIAEARWDVGVFEYRLEHRERIGGRCNTCRDKQS